MVFLIEHLTTPKLRAAICALHTDSIDDDPVPASVTWGDVLAAEAYFWRMGAVFGMLLGGGIALAAAIPVYAGLAVLGAVLRGWP